MFRCQTPPGRVREVPRDTRRRPENPRLARQRCLWLTYVELKEPPGVTDVRVPAFEREIDPCQFSERALPRSEAMNEGTEAKHPRKQTPYFVSFGNRPT